MPENWETAGFGLYVHWPFCQSKCPYCDFNSHVVANVDQSVWADALVAEIERISGETGPRTLTSIFFGGGTPSLMLPETVSAVISAAQRVWRFPNDIEITLEANPTSVEATRFAGFRQAGVNRISLGVQALHDTSLRALGRLHSVDDALRAVGLAQSLFDRVSFDLIYARQDQGLKDWQAELDRALAIGTDHLSLYQLTIEDGTAFGDRFRRGLLRGLPDDDLSSDMYMATQAACEAAGMQTYEVSNHARPDAYCRHNMVYWRGGDYAGVGPGAHGRLMLGTERIATEAVRAPGEWLKAQRDNGSGELPREIIAGVDQAEEYLMMSLRLAEGCDINRYLELGGNGDFHNKINGLEEINAIRSQDGRIIATASGRMVLNAVTRELLA